jgi:carbamoyltransferase
MYILGISCYYHDAAAALIKEGEIIAAAEEERFTRIKHDFNFPDNAIRFCLEEAGIKGQDLDYVVFYEKPFQKFERILMTTFQGFPRSWKVFREAMIIWLGDKLWVKSLLKDKIGIEEKKILFSDHHLSHASSCFYPSPFEEAAILTVDGVGEWTTASMAIGKGTEVKIIKELKFPHSLGMLYSAFTAFLGFKVNNGEYKVMGMAPYGLPKYKDEIFNERFEKIFGKPRSKEMNFFTSGTRYPSYFGEKPDDYEQLCRINEHYANIAASIQKVTEEILLKMSMSLYKETGFTKLCIAGGVGLNSVANGRILSETPFDSLFIQPAAGDSGGALGAALRVYHGLMGKPRKFTLENVYLGKDYSEAEVKNFLEENNISYEYMSYDDKLIERVVNDLVQGKVVGWYQGRFEWGPRALGNRSILADPRSEEMKDLVNIKIKFREPFRPFAPVILEQNVGDFFAADNVIPQYPARYMLLVLPLKSGKADSVSAVNHMGTGRLQTIREEWNPRYYSIVKQFGESTGVPVLLNTSFNLRGEPIVNSPANAYNTFSKSGIDVLVLENFYVKK